MQRARAGVGAFVVVLGCSSAGPPVTGGDAGSDVGAIEGGRGEIDVGPGPIDTGGGAVDRPLVTCTIAPTAAASYHLHGEGVAYEDAGGTVGVLRRDLDLYLPQGRVAGGPVVLAFQTFWPTSALAVVEGRFGADLSVTGLDWVSTYGGVLSFRGRMAGPSGALTLSLSGNLNGETDILRYGQGELALCPSGEVPAPTLRSNHRVSPRGVVDLTPSTPIVGDVSVVRLIVGGSAVPADVTLRDGVLSVAARSWLAPGATVTIDPGGLRDVMGRAFAVDGAVTALATTAVITDREFNVAPPEGAVSADIRTPWSDGRLRSDPGQRMPFRVLMALGALGSATRLSAHFDFGYHCVHEYSAWIVAADGTNTPLPLGAGTATPDNGQRVLTGALPGTGARWLLVESRSVASPPGSLPLGACVFTLDRILLE